MKLNQVDDLVSGCTHISGPYIDVRCRCVQPSLLPCEFPYGIDLPLIEPTRDRRARLKTQAVAIIAVQTSIGEDREFSLPSVRLGKIFRAATSQDGDID